MKPFRTQRLDLDPEIVRRMPFLSKRRRDALRNLNDMITAEEQGIDLTRGYSMVRIMKHVLFVMSSRTLELLYATFAPDANRTTRFMRCIEKYGDGEMEVRAILSYWDTLTNLSLHRALLIDSREENDAIHTGVKKAFTAAQSQHPDFMIDDVSVLTGESRAKFAALLTLFASTITGDNSAPAMIPRDITRLVMSRHERAFDIVEFQKSLGMPFEDLDATLLETFLDNPSPALSAGLL